MANVYRNRFSHGWNGASGEPFVVHQKGTGKTIAAGKPLSDDTLTSTARHALPQAAVRDSALYASFAENQAAYIRLAAEMGRTAYDIAVADWYGAPRVLEIDIDHWRGNPGETIRVKARDNVMVARVLLVIRDSQGQVLEIGKAFQSEAGSLWWNYTTRSPVSLMPFPILQAIAFDLPGNRDSFTIG